MANLLYQENQKIINLRTMELTMKHELKIMTILVISFFTLSTQNSKAADNKAMEYGFYGAVLGGGYQAIKLNDTRCDDNNQSLLGESFCDILDDEINDEITAYAVVGAVLGAGFGMMEKNNTNSNLTFGFNNVSYHLDRNHFFNIQLNYGRMISTNKQYFNLSNKLMPDFEFVLSYHF